MRYFNTTGPVVEGEHYLIDPLSRVDLRGIEELIAQSRYFVLHAPRQTGKTTTLLALAKRINPQGQFKCLYLNIEDVQAAGDDIAMGMRLVLSRLASSAASDLGDDFLEQKWFDIWQRHGELGCLYESLKQWAEHSVKPLVIMFDEVDMMVGRTLLTFMRGLRAGYDRKPRGFPSSVVLCGVLDVKDYRIKHVPGEGRGSSFNIKADSLRLGDFDEQEVLSLLVQHTDDTGQHFDANAVSAVWKLTMGQPWLVNALAYEACFRMEEGRERSAPITEEMIHKAKERLVARRETHLDQLGERLREGRVKRVVEAMLTGGDWSEDLLKEDLQYCIDLGLVAKRDDEGNQIANPIYREILPRELSYLVQENLEAKIPRLPYVGEDGSLLVEKLLESFQQFYRENVEWADRFDYKEAGQQLLLQSYLQRVINGGGIVEREYGMGRGRTDLFIRWPLGDGFSPGQPVQRVVIEIKVVHEKESADSVVDEGLKQTVAYMDRCGTDEGQLVVFDKRAGRTWDETLFRRDQVHEGKRITVWGV